MPRISYNLNTDSGEWSEVSPDNKDVLLLRFHPQKDGYIIIDNALYRVKSGEMKIPLSRLNDCEYELRLECDGESFTLEGFQKLGADIVMLPTNEATIRSLLHGCRKNEEKIKILEDKLSRLIERTEGHRIFN